MNANSSNEHDTRGHAAYESDRYEEWLLDESLRMSFPASDPASTSQPGSVVYERYARLGRLSGTSSVM